MPSFSFQKPTDQPTGASRLLEQLRVALGLRHLNEFYLMVAFAKSGFLIRLQTEINDWRASGKSIRAIIGIDERGTSKDALEFALSNFDETYIAHIPGRFAPTFHPKLYLFNGDSHGLAFLGSNNLTVGGLETNFESHIRIEMDLPADSALYHGIFDLWNDALQVCATLSNRVLQQLVAAGLVIEEVNQRRSSAVSTPGGSSNVSITTGQLFPQITCKPPSPIPRGVARQRRMSRASNQQQRPQRQVVAQPLNAQVLIIQIIPHHNGEVFLSKNAVDQDPNFFGWPFTGLSTPKRSSNQPYPQRLPDPIVKLRVYNISDNLVVEHDPYNLNTVYYSLKSEIRITVPPDVVQATPSHSILLMQQSNQPGYNYEMDIYIPGSPKYTIFLQSCNQTMPSGGSPNPRRFGWL